MICPSCKTHYPDGAKCCSKCGVQFRWEYKDSTIQLHQLNSNTPNLAERFNQCVAKHLQEVGATGWQPAGPTDWDSLLASGRIEFSKDSIGAGPPVKSFRSATVRLKRLHHIHNQPPAPVSDEPRPGITPEQADRQIRVG